MDRSNYIKVLLLGVTEKLDWFTELPYQLLYLYENSREIRSFLIKDRSFWRKIFARVGLRIRQPVENYFLYYMRAKWMKKIKYQRGKRLEFWGGACFLEKENGFFTIYPGTKEIHKNYLNICRKYLCILEDDKISVYFEKFNEKNIVRVFKVLDDENLAIYIRETIIGVVIGFNIAPETWRAILLNGQSIPCLDNVPPKNISICGFRDIHGYHRFDNSPLMDWEEILSTDACLIHPTDSSKAMIMKGDYINQIFCFDVQTGYETDIHEKLKRSDYIIQNLSKTKLYIFHQ